MYCRKYSLQFPFEYTVPFIALIVLVVNGKANDIVNQSVKVRKKRGSKKFSNGNKTEPLRANLVIRSARKCASHARVLARRRASERALPMRSFRAPRPTRVGASHTTSRAYAERLCVTSGAQPTTRECVCVCCHGTRARCLCALASDVPRSLLSDTRFCQQYFASSRRSFGRRRRRRKSTPGVETSRVHAKGLTDRLPGECV